MVPSRRIMTLLCWGLLVGGPAAADLKVDEPKICAYCEAWNLPQQPFRIHGNTYYVGTAGLSAVLVTTDDGHILFDGGLPQSAPVIDDNIRALGFKTEDVRFIANSHAHFDHAGGIAALQRASGATVVASRRGGRALEAGSPTPDDPQFGFGPAFNGFPAVEKVKTVQDREGLTLGDVTLTPHVTSGHTPGGVTWTWASCENGSCVNIVYADSLNAVSAPGYRFSGTMRGGNTAATLRKSIERVAGLPCDILLTVHPDFIDVQGKLQGRADGVSPDPFIEPGACGAYARTAAKRLEKRLIEEKR